MSPTTPDPHPANEKWNAALHFSLKGVQNYHDRLTLINAEREFSEKNETFKIPCPRTRNRPVNKEQQSVQLSSNSSYSIFFIEDYVINRIYMSACGRIGILFFRVDNISHWYDLLTGGHVIFSIYHTVKDNSDKNDTATDDFTVQMEPIVGSCRT